MRRYPLAKLVEWSGDEGLKGRKRLQKMVYFLQAAGWDLGAEYSLHHFGPYSRDVAEASDDLVAMGVIDERDEQIPTNGSSVLQYIYTLNPQRGTVSVEEAESRSPDAKLGANEFREFAVRLQNENLWVLELGSTIHFFYNSPSGGDWEAAVRRALEFKKRDNKDPCLAAALQLAKDVELRRSSSSSLA